MASFHPHYLTSTPQTYHHPVHQFRSWPTQMTSPSHPQARVQPRYIYSYTYIKFLPGQYNLHSVHPRPCRIYEQSGPQNTQHLSTHTQIIKALTATRWGKQKETLIATYNAVMRLALKHASSIWSPLASSTSINKLQVMQNAALRTSTGCTQETNIHKHLQLHASQYKQETQHPSPTHNKLQHSKNKKHYFQQWPLHNKHSHRPSHSHQ